MPRLCCECDIIKFCDSIGDLLGDCSFEDWGVRGVGGADETDGYFA